MVQVPVRGSLSQHAYPLLVALGAMLWGTDLLLRPAVLSRGCTPASVVFVEHVFLSMIFIPILYVERKSVLAAWKKRWASLVALSWGGSALATWLYTTSFTLGPPLTAILLQKVQPLFAILLASLWLGERRRPLFWAVFAVALAGAYLLSGIAGIPSLRDARSLEAIYALAAAALWGAATVFGRSLSEDLDPLRLAGTRFLFAIPPLTVAAIYSAHFPNALWSSNSPILFLFLIVLIPDLAGMVIYYIGLRRTPASVATIAELCYPVTSLAIGVGMLHSALLPEQWVGFGLLAASVLWISLDKGLMQNPVEAAEMQPSP